jgi:replicative DNA helicase
MNRERAIEEIRRQEPTFLQEAKRKGFICPTCGNGSGKDGDGIVKDTSDKSGTHYKCFKCGIYADVIELYGKANGIEGFNEQLAGAGAYYRISIDSGYGARITVAEAFSEQYQKQAGTEQNTHNNTNSDVQEQDYTSFYRQAHSHIKETDYPQRRGLSDAVISRFMLGYVESWRHPKAPNAPASPRLIIPTSKHSYLARDTRAELTPEQEKYSKSKVGAVRIFNTKALQTVQKPIFITEGEIDALSIIEVGGEAIATGSTANRRALLKLLKSQRPSQPLIIAMDNDEAGFRAAEELAEGLQGLSIPFYRLNPYGDHKDANEALNADREGFKAAIERAEQVDTETLEAVREVEREQLQQEAAVYTLPDFLKKIEDSKQAAFIPTGFSNLDSILDGGLYAGLYIVGAISSLGKTTFCLQIADQIAGAGQDVLIFSLEMAREELIAKSVSRFTLIEDMRENNSATHAKTTRGIMTGTRYPNYSDTERRLIQSAVVAYGNIAGNIYITQGIGDVGIEEIREKVQKHIKLTGKAPVVIIDYLQIIAPADMRATDKQNTDKAVLELKRLSRDCSIPIIGISSFNRDNYTVPVNLASYKESGAIEYSSDVLIGLQYDGMDYQEGEADGNRQKRIRELVKQTIADAKNARAQSIQVKILKNRNGSKGEVLLSYYPMFNYFKDDEREGGNDGNWKRIEGSYQ